MNDINDMIWVTSCPSASRQFCFLSTTASVSVPLTDTTRTFQATVILPTRSHDNPVSSRKAVYPPKKSEEIKHAKQTQNMQTSGATKPKHSKKKNLDIHLQHKSEADRADIC